MITRYEAGNYIEELKRYAIGHGRAEDTWYTYHNHVYGAAELARRIAERVEGIDAERAYVLALLHDIGYEKDDREKRFHGLVGYNFMKDKDEGVARICLTHTFLWNRLEPYDEIAWKFFDKKEDYDFVKSYVESRDSDDYDLLVQLVDCLVNKDGFVTLEQRATEYFERRGVKISQEHMNKVLRLKTYFDDKLGFDLYDLFLLPFVNPL